MRLDEHRREPASDWIDTAERMRKRWNCVEFQHFINGFKKESPERSLGRQLGAVERYLDERSPDRAFVAEVMSICCRDFRYTFTQFREVYERCEREAGSRPEPAAGGRPSPPATSRPGACRATRRHSTGGAHHERAGDPDRPALVLPRGFRPQACREGAARPAGDRGEERAHEQAVPRLPAHSGVRRALRQEAEAQLCVRALSAERAPHRRVRLLRARGRHHALPDRGAEGARMARCPRQHRACRASPAWGRP